MGIARDTSKIPSMILFKPLISILLKQKPGFFNLDSNYATGRNAGQRGKRPGTAVKSAFLP
jgi:hypothetical protein